jgi:flagellar basal-body rod protein FlgF
MENALLIGLSRQITLERQIDVISNNVANVNTNGYKADKSQFQEYLSPVAHADNFIGRDRLVSYVQDRATWHDFGAGAIEQTGNPLDVALDGNSFLAVQTPAGERYTRDGGLQINSQGQLTTTDGNLVLGTGGPITFQPNDSDITISSDGTITVREGVNTLTDAVRGKLRIANFAAPQQLLKEGANLYSSPAGVTAQADTTSRVRQGFIEKSNVSSVVEMSHLIEASRAYTSIAGMVQQQSDTRRNAIEKLADVPN